MNGCVSLFSGIGGLDHGLARAGFRHLAFCESDAYRRDVLAARWPGVPVYADVRHPATRGEAREDLAGTLGGGAGERGRAQDVERMTFVPQLGRALTKGERYDGDTETFIAGPLGGGNDGTGRRSEDDPSLVAYALRKNPGGTGQGHNTNYVASTVRSHTRPGSNTDATVVQEASVRRLMPVECERLQALPDGWTDLGGTADSKRYAALGDAVTSSVAEWIGRRMIG